MKATRFWAMPGLLMVACTTVSGCGWTGLNSLELPGAKGHGAGSFTVVIEMPDVTTISANSPVMVNDVVVGSITSIKEEHWHAKVTVTLDQDVDLPVNCTAKIAQTSLLGSKHIELAVPADPQSGRLHSGSVISLGNSGEYPTTEQTLSALSLVLNGGGLGQLQSIVTEVNKALDGRQAPIGDLVTQLDTLLGTLDRQRDAITTTIANLDRFAGQLARDRDALSTALTTLDPALKVLADQRTQLDTALAATDRLGDTGTQLVRKVRGDLAANLQSLQPTLQKIGEAGMDFVNQLGYLTTLPFPQVLVDQAMRGDYANLWALIDLTVPRLRSDTLAGTPLGTPPAPTGGGR